MVLIGPYIIGYVICIVFQHLSNLTTTTIVIRLGIFPQSGEKHPVIFPILPIKMCAANPFTI